MAETNGAPTQPDVDVVVVGAGFAGLYMLHKLRGLGFTATVLEAAEDVGGTWFWNRYPGARCDIPTTDYTFGFDPELEAEWTWSEKYATQPEILRYLQFVAERYDLRRDIRFSTRATEATWDESNKLWRIGTDPGPGVTARHYVMATGCLSVPKELDIAGADRFRGEVYFTSRWPHEGVDFTGKRVGVIGTGSSGIQSIPLIAKQASELTVFQRTPNFSIPAHNGPAPESSLAEIAADRAGYRDRAKWSRIGVPREPAAEMAAQLTPEERKTRFDAAVAEGTLGGILASLWADLGTNPEANNLLVELLHERIRSIVRDPETAEALCPTDHYFGTKRPCLDTGYYETFNEPHVKLVNLRKEPITTVTETGIETAERSFEFDAIVYATGFDAMTGAIVGVDITGKGGRTLKEKWDDGPHTYLGLQSVGFPNLFMVTGPQSPSVLSNMAVSIEQHVEWIADCLTDMREAGYTTIEPTQTAEDGWELHNADCAAITLHPTANSWYMGANVPDKPRVFLAYIGGVDAYRAVSDEVREKRYLGFRLEGPGGVQENDGVVRRVQPDVAMVLDMMASLDLPPLESMTPAEARAFMEATNADRPTGPEVGEIVDGVLPGPAGDLAYRLYRPDTPGPHPLVVYYHGGGWVLGSADSDDPLCRDLCARSGVAIISVDYRHGPEARFPASHDDAWAALQWVGDHVTELGGIPGQLAVAGWSAGGNLAAVVAQQARDAGGPELVGQLLLTPVTDSDMSRPSYSENGEGYVLTKPLMDWFFDHYVDPADRLDPRMAPLHADLANLPPAVIITGEFDPLRDEGNAYAEALERAGNRVRLIPARGHTHTSMTMVDVVLSGAPYRERMAEAIAGFFARVPA